MPNANFAADGGGYEPEAIKAAILAELADLKETVNSFGFQAIKDGSWFAKFIQSCLSSYDQRVMQQGGAAYLHAKYPGLPTDAIAGKLCELAETYAAVAGGVSGAAASAAVLTAGMAIPAAISGVMAESSWPCLRRRCCDWPRRRMRILMGSVQPWDRSRRQPTGNRWRAVSA
jgi:hypothetical protein